MSREGNTSITDAIYVPGFGGYIIYYLVKAGCGGPEPECAPSDAAIAAFQSSCDPLDLIYSGPFWVKRKENMDIFPPSI